MARLSILGLTVLVMGLSSMSSYADVVCKASMMGRICFDSNGKELTVAEMQAALKEADKKDAADKVAKK
ncbi:MAG: hypothetical protein Q7V02_07570 [Methylophilus sp.]|nr:hypothetical protein [Methylophilus sp.]